MAKGGEAFSNKGLSELARPGAAFQNHGTTIVVADDDVTPNAGAWVES